jgi:parallel beta-helix repeat protein
VVIATKRRSITLLTSKLKLAGSALLLALFVTGLAAQTQVSADATPWPATPPAAICGDTELLAGPDTAPSGAVTVPAGDHTGFNFNQPGATFWFAPGTHTFGDDIYGQIIARDNATYVGAPGAIIDGQNLNRYAFTGFAENVTVKHLTIQNFGRGNDNNNEGVVNHDAGTNWTIEYNTIIDNDGAGVFLGSDNNIRYNCMKDNGQYGFSMFKEPIEGDSAIKNIVIDHNEIAGNNTDDWENQIDGCGCSGAGKFWDVNGATITNNWVHDNLSTGLWADTNNIDFLIEGNYIENNDGEGIWYEISYNATIRNNTLRHNAWVSGQANTGSPAAAIYLSESGGDSRLDHSVSGAAEIRIYDNNFDNNFSGVSIYENANRFCNSNGNTSKGYCTPLVTPTWIPAELRDYDYPNPISSEHPCYTNVASEPYTTDCRWHAKNIKVYENEFHFDNTVVPCAGTYCGAQALIATGSNNMPWSPYTVSGIQNDVMFNNGNSFHDNAYFGDWVFAKGYGETVSFNDWQASPYNQDANSTFDGNADNAGSGVGGGGGTTPQVTVDNELDADTAGLEGSAGQWYDWYSASAAQSSAEAHTGTHSLKVDVTDPWGWGIEAANWPGFESSEGVKSISLWGKLGSGTNLQPKMRVKWVDSSNATLRTDDVTLPALTTSWQQATAVVEAPAGTATVLVYLLGSGSPGDALYFDDMVVGNAPNAVSGDSGTFESSAGEWANWYSATVAASSDAAHRGTGSLKVTVTDPWGWAAQLANWPGFDVAPGAKRVSFWTKQGSGAISDVTLRIKWFDATQQLLQTDLVSPTSLSANWEQATASITAPTGTATAYLDMYSTSGSATDTLYIDDISLTDAPQ